MERINNHQCLIGVFLIFFICFYTFTSAVVNEKMIIDEIKYCEPLKALQNSHYMAKCSKIPFPINNNDNNNDIQKKNNLALCMVIFESINKICHTINDTNNNAVISLLIKDSSELNNKIKDLEPKPKDNTIFLNNFCKKIVSILKLWNCIDTQSNPIVHNYIQYVTEVLFGLDECQYTCHEVGQINPLCMILSWFSELLSSMKCIAASNTILLKSTVASDIMQKELSTAVSFSKGNQKNKISTDFSKNKQQKVEENTSPMNKLSSKKPSEQSSQLGILKSPDNIKEANISVHSDTKKHQDSYEIEAVNEAKKFTVVPSVISNNANNIPYKPSENFKDKPKNIQQEEGNLDKEKFFEDNNQNKNINENRDEDSEEAMMNSEDEQIPIKNSDSQSGFNEDDIKQYSHSPSDEDESHFFTYFSVFTLMCIGLYIGYHNKQKILAIVLEGRRSRRGRNSRRRPSTASYHKLDCNLEEAVTSQCNTNVSHVIY